MTTTTLGATAPAAVAAGVPAVRLAGVTKDFAQDGQSVHAVRGIDLELAQGEVVAFLGPNGAGKTTTIDMVLGLSQPTSGEVSVLGLEPRAAIARGLVSAVMQTGGLLKDLTVARDRPLHRQPVRRHRARRHGARHAPASPASPTARSASAPAASSSGSGSRWPCSPTRRSCCSTSRRPAWTSRAAAPSGPRSALTPHGGAPCVFATHYLEEADQYADRIVLVSKGRIVADGTGAQIKAMTTGRTVRATPPDADATVLHELAGLGGVDGVETRGEIGDRAGQGQRRRRRFLLTRTDARDLEITAHGLEEAFFDPHRRHETSQRPTAVTA